MEDIDYLLDLVYKNKKVRFRVTNPDLPLANLMNNVKHAVGIDGKLIFDFPSIDETGAPMDYFFGKEDPVINEIRVMRPRIGKRDQTLADYGVHNGDTLFLIPDPFPG
ncbi:MAG: hypothetical protein HUK14_04185 [Muribaculaceae bacterium]|nr:hypothetical protein [Muribaculaceae bacterium]